MYLMPNKEFCSVMFCIRMLNEVAYVIIPSHPIHPSIHPSMHAHSKSFQVCDKGGKVGVSMSYGHIPT